MIIDNIKNYEKYIAVNPKFKGAFEFIKTAVEENLGIGRYELENGDYAFVQEYQTKNEEDCVFEGHRKYIDIQYIVSGVEAIAVADISKTTVKNEYNQQKDIQFFENCERAAVTVIDEGEYGIFFPYDIHKPGMAYNKLNVPVRKIVVKVGI